MSSGRNLSCLTKLPLILMQETATTTKNSMSTNTWNIVGNHLIQSITSALVIHNPSLNRQAQVCLQSTRSGPDGPLQHRRLPGILETGLRSYWQTAPWENRSPSSHRQSLTVNQRQTATSSSRQKGLC